MKMVNQYIKDEERSPLFTKSGKLSGLSQTIYDLLISGIKGYLKRDAVLTALSDISVRIKFISSIAINEFTCLFVHIIHIQNHSIKIKVAQYPFSMLILNSCNRHT